MQASKQTSKVTEDQFAKLAAALRGVRPALEWAKATKWNECVRAVADALQDSDPQFETRKFIKACGGLRVKISKSEWMTASAFKRAAERRAEFATEAGSDLRLLHQWALASPGRMQWLANHLGVHPTQINTWFTGKVTPSRPMWELIHKLALQIDPDDVQNLMRDIREWASAKRGRYVALARDLSVTPGSLGNWLHLKVKPSMKTVDKIKTLFMAYKSSGENSNGSANKK